MVPPKIKNTITIRSSNTTFGYVYKNWKQGLKDIFAILFTIAER